MPLRKLEAGRGVNSRAVDATYSTRLQRRCGYQWLDDRLEYGRVQ